jgi:pimeloyl-ACP methyl ester carboxylesterase
MAARPDSHADIAAFHGPVLSIRGTQDKVASAEDHQKMMDVSREGIHIDIEECGHLAPIEKPEETSRAIIEFLNSVKKISC